MNSSRQWMYDQWDGNYLKPEYVAGVEEFVEWAARQHLFLSGTNIRCPCNRCWNNRCKPRDDVLLHLYKYGFRPNYYTWESQGENYDVGGPSNQGQGNQSSNMEVDSFVRSHQGYSNCRSYDNDRNIVLTREFFEMLQFAEHPIYEGCRLSLLAVASRVINITCEYKIALRTIDAWTSLMKDVLPNDNIMVDTFNRTKKLLNGLRMPCQYIDVCTNGCMLFWKEHENKDSCAKCNEDRFRYTTRGRKIAKKQLIYFPLTPRLQRLYATKNVSKNMLWHYSNRGTDGVMSHPCHGSEWSNFDDAYPNFAAEPRNVRLGLCIDGFAPSAKSGSRYSCWPVVVTPYNLPPWMCMKRKFMFLNMLIPGPCSPKENLDIYLRPLVDELKYLWDFGALTYDISRNQNFTMHAALLWTISDFPTYGMLSGWRTSPPRQYACPICMEDTKSFSLHHGNKVSWFDCHRRFLPPDHVFRRNKNNFRKNSVERDGPPDRLDGEILFEIVSTIPKTEDKHYDGQVFHLNWVKQSLFWELPYWKKLTIRHNLDAMHIEKNVFEQVIWTILGITGKTKDNLTARKDVAKYCNRPALHLSQVRVRDGLVKLKMPKPSFLLNKQQRICLCKWLKEFKFPDGFASNWGCCVNVESGNMFGWKSHDCHLFMELLMPVAFRYMLPSNVWKALTELSQFFRDICARSLSVDEVTRLENNIAEIICKLEMIFPPSWFDVMEHLPVHLPYEAKVGGPVQFRWMYPFKRFLFHLKKKIGNKAHVEKSICQAYLLEEISNFCSYYFDNDMDTDLLHNAYQVQNQSIPPDAPEVFSACVGYAPSKGTYRFLNDKEYIAAHYCVLLNSSMFDDYESTYREQMQRRYPGLSMDQIIRRFSKDFPEWLRLHVGSNMNITDEYVRALAAGPNKRVLCWNQYYINGYNFHTYGYGQHKTTMNYGVTVMSSENGSYYGILQEVVELLYFGNDKALRCVVFRCEWFDPDRGIQIHDDYKLVDIDYTRQHQIYEPFIMSYQADQVYYAPYPSVRDNKDNLWAVFESKPRPQHNGVREDHNAVQEDVVTNPPLLSAPKEIEDGDHVTIEGDDVLINLGEEEEDIDHESSGEEDEYESDEDTDDSNDDEDD